MGDFHARSIRAWVVALFIICVPAPVLSQTPTAAPEEITFWHFSIGTVGTDFQQILQRFNEVQNRYRVKSMVIPWNSNQKILTALAGGIPPDVLMMDRPNAPMWYLRGALEDITPFVLREGWSDKEFFSVGWDECQYRGQFLMIPLYDDVRCLIYNRDLFQKAGLDPDRPPKTWDELYDYAQRLTERDSSGRIVTLGFEGWHDIWLLLGWENGGNLTSDDLSRITLDTQPYLEGLQFYKKLIDSFGLENYLRFLSSGGAAFEAQDPFFRGHVAMKLVTGFYIVRLRQIAPHVDARLAPFPMPVEGPPVSWVSGFALAMPRGARHPEGAWAFMRYMASPETQLALASRMGVFPSRREAAYDPSIYDDPDRRVVIDMMDNCKHYPQIPVIGELYNNMFNAVEAVLYDKTTPEQALASVQRNVQTSLDEYSRRERLPRVRWEFVVWPMVLLAIAGLAFAARWANLFSKRGKTSRQRLLNGYLFASPWLIGLIIFLLGPIIVSFVYSFCDYQVLTPSRWNGMHNYVKMLTDDPLFWKSLWNTVYYTIFAVPLGSILAMLLALLLNQPLRGMKIFRTVFYLPSLVTGVALGVLWIWILQPEYGIMNRFLEWFGIQGPLWIQSQHWSKPSLILMSFWGVGGSMIIFLAGLQGIPRQLYEAAEIDGAGPWGQFRFVTLPMLTPTIFFVLVVGIIASFQVFTQAFVVSGGMGGPVDSTLFYVFHLYRKGFEDFQMGYASAMAWILFIIIFLFTMIQVKLSKKWVHY